MSVGKRGWCRLGETLRWCDIDPRCPASLLIQRVLRTGRERGEGEKRERRGREEGEKTERRGRKEGEKREKRGREEGEREEGEREEGEREEGENNVTTPPLRTSSMEAMECRHDRMPPVPPRDDDDSDPWRCSNAGNVDKGLDRGLDRGLERGLYRA